MRKDYSRQHFTYSAVVYENIMSTDDVRRDRQGTCPWDTPWSLSFSRHQWLKALWPGLSANQQRNEISMPNAKPAQKQGVMAEERNR